MLKVEKERVKKATPIVRTFTMDEILSMKAALENVASSLSLIAENFSKSLAWLQVGNDHLESDRVLLISEEASASAGISGASQSLLDFFNKLSSAYDGPDGEVVNLIDRDIPENAPLAKEMIVASNIVKDLSKTYKESSKKASALRSLMKAKNNDLTTFKSQRKIAGKALSGTIRARDGIQRTRGIVIDAIDILDMLDALDVGVADFLLMSEAERADLLE